MKVQYIEENSFHNHSDEKNIGFWQAELLTRSKFQTKFPMSDMVGGIFKGELRITDLNVYFEFKKYHYPPLNHQQVMGGTLKIPRLLIQEIQGSKEIQISLNDGQICIFKVEVGHQDVKKYLREGLNATTDSFMNLSKDVYVMVKCPECQAQMQVPINQHILSKCMACQFTFEVDNGKVLENPHKKIEINCPECQTKLKIPKNQNIQTSCHHCKAVLTVKTGLIIEVQPSELDVIPHNQDDAQPTEQDVLIRQTFCIHQDEFVLDLDISSSLYHYFKEKDVLFRKMYPYMGQTVEVWFQQHFAFYWNDEKEAELLNRLLDTLYHLTFKAKKYYFIELVVAYVQGAIEYDYAKLEALDSLKNNHPYETICSGLGVCRDTALLMVKLLNLMDYDAVMLIFEQAKHAGIGLKVPQGQGDYIDSRGVAYCYIETTDYWRIGDIPDKYAETTYLDGDYPIFVYPKNNGERAFDEIETYRQKRVTIVSQIWKTIFGR
jgi:hypothetical protein